MPYARSMPNFLYFLLARFNLVDDIFKIFYALLLLGFNNCCKRRP